MSQAAAVQTVAPIRPRDYAPAQLQLIKRTVAVDLADTEFNLFMEVARRVGLDPFRRQIYAVIYNKDTPARRRMSIITGIDGFRAVAARGQDYRPDDAEPQIVYDEALRNPQNNPLGIVKASVRCFKYGPDKQWHPVVGVAYWDEFAPLDEGGTWEETGETWPNGGPKKTFVGNGNFTLRHDSRWRSMARVMLPKCAEAQAIRKGWPEDLSGVYAPEEMARAETIDATATQIISAHRAEERLKLVHAKDAVAVWWRADDPLELVPIGQFADRACAFFKAAISNAEIQSWARTNSASLRHFWAIAKADALGVKKAMEKRLNELATPGAAGK